MINCLNEYKKSWCDRTGEVVTTHSIFRMDPQVHHPVTEPILPGNALQRQESRLIAHCCQAHPPGRSDGPVEGV